LSEPRIISVSSLNMYVKSKLESDQLLKGIYVKGEISNFKGHYSSGHLYFSLKDDGGAVSAVMFSREASKLKFRPADGMKVIVRCRVSLYEKTGSYQIYCDEMQPLGVGELYIAYEQLKKKLSGEGLFSEEHKKALPKYPKRVGVVTSGSGAARRDIENILSRRYPLADIIIAPVLVQGEGAPKEIIGAIEEFNQKQAADVLIVGRGGGSIEDLWAFNDEGVARAIYASKIPVISAVGHETDFTIADFVADLRAPTPSAAAELSVPDVGDLRMRINMLVASIKKGANNKALIGESILKALMERPSLSSPMFYFEDKIAALSMAEKRLEDAYFRNYEKNERRFKLTLTAIEAYSPLKVLSRGYSIAMDGSGNAVGSVKALNADDLISLRLSDGTAQCRVIKTEEFD